MELNLDDAVTPIAPIYEPEPLRAPLPNAEAYPVEALGEVLGKAAIALQETVKAPLALCCQAVLASAALAAQAHFDVMLPWGQKKPLSLFLLSVAESGERKSGIDDVVLGAAKAQEREEMAAYEFEQEKFEMDLAKWKSAFEAANKKPIKSEAGNDFAAAAAHDNPRPKPPISPLRFVTEPTVEGLYKLLAVGQPSVGLFSDEAGLLIGGHAMNSDNALKTMARLCKFWDGASFDRVRAGDGSGSLYGRRLSMHQQAQPDVMAKLLSDPMANGQGFLARCLVAWPESTIGTRYVDQFEWSGDRQEMKRLFAVLKQLMEAEPRHKGMSEQELDPVELPLDADAQKIAIGAVNQFETLMLPGNDLYEIRDRTAKAVENACRIAGVLAVIDGGMATRSISAKHLSQGLVIIQWYLQEALRIRGAAVIPQAVKDAESLSRWLDDRGMRVFRSAHVLTKGPSQLRNKARFKGAIDELLENGFLIPNESNTEIDGVKAKLSWTVCHVV